MRFYTRGVYLNPEAPCSLGRQQQQPFTLHHFAFFLGNELWIHFPSVLADKIRFILDDAFYHAKIAEINIHKEGKITYKHN